MRCWSSSCRRFQGLAPLRVSLLEDLPDTQGCYGLAARLLASLLRLRQDLPTLAGLLAALAGCQRLLRPLWRLLQGAPHPLVKASARQLLELLAKVADQERELGCYEVTLAGLELIEGLFQACPVELLALPQAAQRLVSHAFAWVWPGFRGRRCTRPWVCPASHDPVASHRVTKRCWGPCWTM